MANRTDRATGIGTLGLISDTHGLLRPEVFAALAGCNLVVHAGDIGKPGIIDRLGALAPVVAVKGNVDTAEWARSLPSTVEVETGPVRIYVLHDVGQLEIDPAAQGFGIVVSGHSHKAGYRWRNGVLYVNPGSAGPRRFRLPITVARLDLQKMPFLPEFIELSPGT